MSTQINHNPVNDPSFPISPDMIEDTEGHRKLRIDGADAVRSPRVEDADAVRSPRVEDADDTEGHIRYPD
ncbi:hypothetical protein [Ilumatobacter sp.]|uniref:hypothetical protein n=1 Tax=Ilumatobacter sp. TaxID=1967498 RepID=UPI003C5AB56C